MNYQQLLLFPIDTLKSGDLAYCSEYEIWVEILSYCGHGFYNVSDGWSEGTLCEDEIYPVKYE